MDIAPKEILYVYCLAKCSFDLKKNPHIIAHLHNHEY